MDCCVSESAVNLQVFPKMRDVGLDDQVIVYGKAGTRRENSSWRVQRG